MRSMYHSHMARQEKVGKILKERTSQKNRTRMALIETAAALMREGKTPTVHEVAAKADISRATAYRYFPTQDMLLAEVALFSAGGPLLLDREADQPLPEWAGQLVRRIGEWSLTNETALRTILRLSLDPTSGIRRPGHRVEWIERALAPAKKQIDPRTYKKLSQALTLLMGIDPIVAMKDIAGASNEELLDSLEWTATALVQAALLPGNRPRR